jgi:hypothetical protein
MPDLHFTAEYIRSLAALQNDVAHDIGLATITADNVGEKVTTTHGSICAVTASAVKDAEFERDKAARLTQAASSDLAVKLEDAAATYDKIDATEKNRIDGQMHPGG